MSDHILVERAGAIATVTFNRPEMRNAISLAMWTEIARGHRRARQGRLACGRSSTGARAPRRSRRAPTSPSSRRTARTRRPRSRYKAQTEAAYSAMRECPKPTVAMIFGYCMGGAMARRHGVRPALRRRGLEVRHSRRAAVSIIYGAGCGRAARRPRGPRLRQGHPVLARTVEDREALAIGLIQRLVPAAELEAYTYDYLGTVADNAPLSVRGAKPTVQRVSATGSTTERRRSARASSRSRPSRARTTGKARGRSSRSAPPRFQGAVTAVRVAVLTSTPPSPREGSGTFVALDGLARGLAAARPRGRVPTAAGPHRVPHARPLALQRGRRAAPPRDADLVLGVRSRRLPVGARRRGRAARLRGGAQGHHRRRAAERARLGAAAARHAGPLGAANTARADLVIVPSRYSAAVAAEVYGVPAERIAVVPEPIDLAAWRRRFARARAAPARAGPTVLAVARMYPRKRLGRPAARPPLAPRPNPGAAGPHRRGGPGVGALRAPARGARHSMARWRSWAR